MLENIWTAYLLEQLNDEAAGYVPPPLSQMPLPDQWIAFSLLQKAIRRGHTGHALRAASYLYHLDHRALWRRLVIIGWEDIGVGNPDLCFTVTAAAGSKRWREAHGGNWHYAAYLTVAMCRAVKDRSTDDLMMVALHDPNLMDQRESYFELTDGQLLSIVNDQSAIHIHRVIAAWYCVGTESYGFEGLRRRKGDVERFFQCVAPNICPEHVTSLCRIGVSRTRTALPAFVPTSWRFYATAELLPFVADGEILEHSLAGIPRCAFDGFTRAGKRYLKKLARQDFALQTFLFETLPPSERDALVREMYFRIESSLCNKRLDWSIGNEARSRADEVGFGLDAGAFNAGKVILRNALTSNPMTEADL